MYLGTCEVGQPQDTAGIEKGGKFHLSSPAHDLYEGGMNARVQLRNGRFLVESAAPSAPWTAQSSVPVLTLAANLSVLSATL